MCKLELFNFGFGFGGVFPQGCFKLHPSKNFYCKISKDLFLSFFVLKLHLLWLLTCPSPTAYSLASLLKVDVAHTPLSSSVTFLLLFMNSVLNSASV